MNFDQSGKFAIKSLGLGIIFLLLVLGSQSLRAENVTNLLRAATSAYAQQDYGQAIDLFNQAVRFETNNFYAYLGRGGTYTRTRQYEKAENDLNTAIALATNIIPLSGAYMNRGFLYQQETNYDRAVDDFSKAVQLNPSFQLAYVYRANVYNLLERFDLSIMDCNMAVLLDPDCAIAYRYKGVAFDGKQNYDKAIEAYGKAIQIETNDVWTYAQRGSAYFSTEDYLDSVKDFDRIIQLRPLDALPYAYRGLSKSRLGNYKGGIEDCRKAIHLDENNFVACNNLAWLLATAPQPNLRDGQHAVKYASHACELTSWKQPYALGTLAASYAEVGDFTNAIKWESKCVVIGLSEKDMPQARKELHLFEDNKPYHADK